LKKALFAFFKKISTAKGGIYFYRFAF